MHNLSYSPSRPVPGLGRPTLYELRACLFEAADAIESTESQALPADHDLSRRLVGITSDDWRNWATIRKELTQEADAIVGAVCQRVTSLDFTTAPTPQPLTVERLRNLLHQYLDSLRQVENGSALVLDCSSRGQSYQSDGIPLQWFLSVKHVLFDVIRERTKKHFRNHPDRLPGLLSALERILQLEESLVVESYYVSGIHGLRALLKQAVVYQNELWQSASFDALTQVFTRGYLFESLEKELQRCRRFNRPLSVLMIDIDLFKEKNDAHGHLAGDFVLRHTCAILRKWLRPNDLVGRYGGDEFVVGLIESDVAAAAAVADRIRVSVAEQPYCYARTEIPITISMGVAGLPPGNTQVCDLLHMADQALYRAKEGGRNSIRIFRELPTQ